jgi:hypothetical protein
MAGHGVNGVIREGKHKREHGGPGGICWLRERASLLQVLLNLMITYGKGGTR